MASDEWVFLEQENEVLDRENGVKRNQCDLLDLENGFAPRNFAVTRKYRRLLEELCRSRKDYLVAEMVFNILS